MAERIFYPTSSGDFVGQSYPGQRYRFPFGDKRLFRQYEGLLQYMSSSQSTVIYQMSPTRKACTGLYRFINNPKVKLEELIAKSCEISPQSVQGRDLLVLIDGTSLGLKSKIWAHEKWGKELGVIEDNRTPGFHLNCALIVDNQDNSVVDLGDVVVFSRFRVECSQIEKSRAREQRTQLPLEEKQTYVWPLNGLNSLRHLTSARSVTYVMDQGADVYESLQRLLTQTKRDFIVRSKEDRMCICLSNGKTDRLRSILPDIPWSDRKVVPIRALNHYSKTNGKLVQRTARQALLRMHYTAVRLLPPTSYANNDISLSCRTLYAIEVKEDTASVPLGETPIHWILLTTKEIKNNAQGWNVVQAYQSRWFIEQLFRVFKKQGLNMERSQLKTANAIKKQAIMALKTAADTMKLVQARDGKEFIPIESMFDEKEIKALQKINHSLRGSTAKQSNPHAENSLAWAAWVIARLGAWKGYQSQRPPGPITMKRGLEKFRHFLWAWDIVDTS